MTRVRRVTATLLLALSAVGLSVAAPTPASAAPGEGVGAPVAVESLTAGGAINCVLLDSGKVKCWGWNDYGQLGYGDTTWRGDGPGEMGDNLAAVDLGAGRTAISISSGGWFHVCALLDNATVKCWGEGGFGLGYGDTNSRGDGPGEMGDNLPAIALGTGRTATSIASGAHHTCALLDNNTVKCWGFGSYGQLGYGNTNDRGDGPGEMGDNLPAVDLGTGRTAVAIAAGERHTCALLDNDTVKCWGFDQFGQLGYGHTNYLGDGPGEMGDNLPAVDLGTGRTAVAIAAGEHSTCALLDIATVKCWGFGFHGRLGYGNTNHLGDGPGEMGDNLPAVELGTGRTATAVTLGYDHTCALLDNNTVKCWGHGGTGQLGYGNTNSRGDGPGEMGDNLPAVDLGAGRTATAIDAGTQHTCTLLDNATVKCWGYGSYGQLGYGNTTWRGDGPGEMGNNLPTVNLGGHPSVALTVPADGASFDQGEAVVADFTCADETAVASCVGDVTDGEAIDTSTLGEQTFTVTATDTAGNETTVTHDYTVVDATDPTVTITTPVDGASFDQSQEVLADFSCADETAVASCVGDVDDGDPIDTSTVGDHTFTVTTTDTAGNETTVTHDYTVVDGTDPTVTITTPADGASFNEGQVVLADFSCADETAVDTCVGDVADGEAIDTSTVGEQTFTVVATDTAGNETTVTHDYTVVDATDPDATITTPANGATYTRGEEVLADYTCTDDVDGESTGCEGDVDSGEPIDTNTLGEHTFTVIATDTAANTATVAHAYTVIAPRCDGRAVTVMLALGDTPTAGDDVILGTPGPDTINALGGNDRICGLSGNDTINGGTGNDRVRGDADRDRVRGGGGNDRLLGQVGNDTLNGGTGADRLNGGPQRDTCTGGPQRDTQTACEIRGSIP